MRKMVLWTVVAMMLLGLTSCSRRYQTVKGDPMNTMMYTLDNGLKIYMSVNKDEPRIQTYIAVRSGGKNDPSDNTGLAHYLEHIMFKGSTHFGTTDYESEKILLDQIEELFNVYKTKTDPDERAAIYHQIDSISYAASRIAIPNEYDKLMAVIGASGSNAFTSNDVTCYTENIPSNQIENWAKVQSDRFKNLVIRGFHTELEAVYEEYNMYLNEDQENAMMAIDSVLFKNHPYGLQSVIGTQEHLKNPSISAIKKQKATYYVPNNVAICLSGDFDPDKMVDVIEKYFGDWEPNPSIPEFSYAPEEPITSPVVKDVYGTEAEFVMLGWRFPGQKDIFDSEISSIVAEILYNGQAGMMDVDINQQQKALAVGVMPYSRVDYGEMLFFGYPKSGQSLEDVSGLILSELEKLRSGDFDQDMIDAAIANFKLQQMRQLEDNEERVNMFMESFIAGLDWDVYSKSLQRLEKVTKQDVIAWADKYLDPNAYVAAYKRLGVNPKSNKIDAPAITAIATNREKQSDFLIEVQNSVPAPVEPVFVDYSKDMSVFNIKPGIDAIYKKNTTNDIAQLVFRFNTGTYVDPALSLAFDYLSYLGTADRSAEELAMEEYKLACEHSFGIGSVNSTYSVTGLSENIIKDLQLVEDLMTNAVADEEILDALKYDTISSRMVNKQTQSACNSALRRYVIYGPEYVKAVNLTNDQVMAVTSEELLSKVKNLLECSHEVLYYGPMDLAEFKDAVVQNHKSGDELKNLEQQYIAKRMVNAPEVFLAPYDSRQFNYIQYSDRGEKYSVEDAGAIEVFNEYFGGGMNTVVFQEMREARALAYSAGAMLQSPSDLKDTYCFYATIGSQNDKLQQAVEAFDEIINDMPLSDKGFDIAVSGMESSLRTQRITGAGVLNSYISSRDLGLDVPVQKIVYESLPSFSLDGLQATQQKWVKDRTYVYGILGDSSDLDMDYLKTLGTVHQLSLEDIFGY